MGAATGHYDCQRSGRTLALHAVRRTHEGLIDEIGDKAALTTFDRHQ